MRGLQIAALICAIILLLPGGCFLFFGLALEPVLVLIALVILGAAGGLFAYAFHRRAAAPLTPVDLTSGTLTAERARRELRLRNYGVNHFVFATRYDVVLPSRERRDFPDEAAFLEWARRELG